MTAARGRVIALAEDGMAWTRSGLARAAGVSLGVVDGLIRQGVFDRVTIPPRPVVPLPDPDYRIPRLSRDQQAAVEQLLATQDGPVVSLIDGVTGSGKTEVYFEAGRPTRCGAAGRC